VRIYRIPARPFWDDAHTNISFFKSGLILGPLALCVTLSASALWGGSAMAEWPYRIMMGIAMFASLLGCSAARGHELDMAKSGGEAAAALDRLTGYYGPLNRLRKALGMGLVVWLAGAMWVTDPTAATWLTVGALVLAIAGEVIERSLFYLVVIPTTMPGAMFLKNDGFEQLARRTGLAEDRAVGVLQDIH